MIKSKEDYIGDFSNLKRNHQYKKPAPQKSIYYLALIDCITTGFIVSHRFPFIPQIKSKFYDYWTLFVGNDETYKADVSQPALYCDSDPFYYLRVRPGEIKKRWHSIKMFDTLYECIEIDEPLFNYIKTDATFAAELRIILVSALR